MATGLVKETDSAIRFRTNEHGLGEEKKKKGCNISIFNGINRTEL